MRRIALALMMLGLALTGGAQDWWDDDSVLQEARKRAQKEQAEQKTSENETMTSVESESREPDAPPVPLVLGFVPGLSVPSEYRTVIVSLNVIGGAAPKVSGIMGSGIFSLSGRTEGILGAGIFTITGTLKGIQGAGVFNIAGGVPQGIQMAGVFNISGSLRGVQGAGLFNTAETVRGIQGAGLFNIAKDVKGIQGAGLFNVAEDVQGLQIGLINVANRVQGLQLGLINVARNGIHDVGLLYDWNRDLVTAYVRSGSSFLYSILQIRLPSDEWFGSSPNPVYGLGLGTRAGSPDLHLDIDLSASMTQRRLQQLDTTTEEWKNINWVYLGSLAFATLRGTVGISLGNGEFLIGYVADVEQSGTERIPASLKTGSVYNVDIYRLSMTLYGSWFIGFSLPLF
ncbi:hypothetical protein [Treponema sp. J25]|uniref:LA_2272 family surface repeat-containing protein n=1 Tax=Treponema sp. J25 TaxID=2094121 RepID=UPI0010483766|nr:hypothetical protein [Treponema sp. J25]TCW61082.1 hypothetical protein C5O22_08375 [Treponema sp. J25]